MECDNYKELISLYFDNELDEKEEKELFEHLTNCPSCRKEYEELKAVMDMLGEIEEQELPEGFHDEVMAKIKAEAKPQKKKIPWARYTSIAASICAVFIVGGAVFATGFMGMGGSQFAADAASPQMYGMMSNTTTTESAKGEIMYDVVVEESAPMEMEELKYASGSTSATNDGAVATALIEDGNEDTVLKMIKRGNVSVRVKNFEDAIDMVKADVEGKGGYVENFNSYVYSDRWVNGKKVSLREGQLVLRVPSETYEATYEYLKTIGEVTNENESRENVTDSYIEVESRMKAKLTEEARLIELLAKAETVDDIIIIEGRLSDVRGEIDGYQSRLDNWDKQVSYSTISLYIMEDPDETIENVSPDLGTRIKNSFARGINNFISDIENIIISFAGNIINLAVFVIVIAVVVIVARKVIKKKFGKKDKGNNQ
ncbi:MAG: DUF4349 domain-containing protein [Lachnospiraceae bacterium]|nr:DUF4349 domain-containing protein [Lachnospiraceae bacterium]